VPDKVSRRPASEAGGAVGRRIWKGGWEIRPFVKRGGLQGGKFPSRFLRNEGNTGSWVDAHSKHITCGEVIGSLEIEFYYLGLTPANKRPFSAISFNYPMHQAACPQFADD
tara:strand:+ start:224 stop:556 length:333 start_codon:yes stop_codon:yes gene_type:complete